MPFALRPQLHDSELSVTNTSGPSARGCAEAHALRLAHQQGAVMASENKVELAWRRTQSPPPPSHSAAQAAPTGHKHQLPTTTCRLQAPTSGAAAARSVIEGKRTRMPD
jgi:hypothetical protein